MRDYFAEFLINPGLGKATYAVPNLGDAAGTTTPIKHHIYWAIVATAIGLASWKASQWFASHKFLTKQTEG